MFDLVERAGDLLGVTRDPALRSTALLVFGIGVYGFLLTRDRDRSATPRRGHGRRWQNADSVLRTAAGRRGASAGGRLRAASRPEARVGHNNWRRARW